MSTIEITLDIIGITIAVKVWLFQNYLITIKNYCIRFLNKMKKIILLSPDIKISIYAYPLFIIWIAISVDQIITYNSLLNIDWKFISIYVLFEVMLFLGGIVLIKSLQKSNYILAMFFRSIFFNIGSVFLFPLFPYVLIEVIKNYYFFYFFISFLGFIVITAFIYTYNKNVNEIALRSLHHWKVEEKKENQILFLDFESFPKPLNNNFFWALLYVIASISIFYFFISRYSPEKFVYFSFGLSIILLTTSYSQVCYFFLLIKYYLYNSSKSGK
ncbi:hypothetical protein RO21_04420 [[Actinobacillus] muris]|uniref:Uncharacterized protein n=1 Tax=Muribacter muris TaxID=67855 RepID=A0A0J5P8G6_9PAST|nr:hypothetical protein [Muribacter muris]KMK51784.1 hypothetical protein RO21_04420 [[Actinobacillus] muris] [Muribacter muris]